MSAPLALQTAVWAKLRADAPLAALLATHPTLGGGAIYDGAPQAADSADAAAFDYVTIGDDTTAEADTDDTLGFEHVVTIHSWSRHQGRAGIKAIQGALYDALHRQTLTVAGYVFEDCFFEQHDSFTDPDGVTRHGVSRFRYRLQPQE